MGGIPNPPLWRAIPFLIIYVPIGLVIALLMMIFRSKKSRARLENILYKVEDVLSRFFRII
ncbi:hypothetical protein CEW46_26955 [Bacillus cereus]|nr:hypothetical protein CEW46_26955 [Bacillus cereus]